jgi:hypothetical protein
MDITYFKKSEKLTIEQINTFWTGTTNEEYKADYKILISHHGYWIFK